MAVIAGVDYSMNSPAIAIWDDETPHEFKNIMFFNYGKVKKLEGKHGVGNVRVFVQDPFEHNEERFRRIANWAKGIFIAMGVTDVCLEGYAMGNSKNSNNIMETAENCSLLKQDMRDLVIPFEVITPSSVKKKFTGNGNAKKPEMIAKFTSLMKHDLVKSMDIQNKEMKPVDDIADAYAILRCHSKVVEQLGEVNVD